jgi:GR25 family glycosyltransferase involved in LPS biosynthesis
MVDLNSVLCCVVNLPERKDRLANFEKTFYGSFGNKLVRVNGIKKEKGFVGCNLSHKEAIWLAKKRGEKNVLIFEDDFEFISEQSYNYIIQAAKNLPDDFDVALFGYYFIGKKHKVNDNWSKIGDFCALHCYLVNEKAYDKIIQLPENYHLDRLIGRDVGIIKYATNKLATKQINGFSDNSKRENNYDNLLIKFDKI